MIRFKFCLHLQRHIYELRLICYAPRFSFMHGGHFLDDDPSLFEKLNCTGAVFLPVTQIGPYANVDNSHKLSPFYSWRTLFQWLSVIPALRVVDLTGIFFQNDSGQAGMTLLG